MGGAGKLEERVGLGSWRGKLEERVGLGSWRGGWGWELGRHWSVGYVVPPSQASMEQTLKLFQGYRRIADILQEKAGAQGGGASGKKVGGALGAVKSNLTLQFVVNLLQALFK